ncbi:MAG: DUF3226 domain-containing protein [Coriobacteriia bacterium]
MVEGKDDEIVLRKLVDHHFPASISKQIDIRALGGIEELLSSIPVQVKASDINTLGLVVDADTSLESRWRSVTSQLSKAGYRSLPTAPQPSGTLVHGGALPNVGIWIMPDNRVPGMLEDFIAFLVPPDDSLWEHAKECLGGVSVKNPSKSLIHTWLAWQGKPGKPLGQAITMRYLDPNAEHSVSLSLWLRAMLEASGTLPFL